VQARLLSSGAKLPLPSPKLRRVAPRPRPVAKTDGQPLPWLSGSPLPHPANPAAAFPLGSSIPHPWSGDSPCEGSDLGGYLGPAVVIGGLDFYSSNRRARAKTRSHRAGWSRPMNSTFRFRKSRLRRWSVRITPWTGASSGKVISKGEPLALEVMGQIQAN
jgi:hypothetical protein